MFLQETDIIATIKGFGLDVNKFWWAVLFVYDWSNETFTTNKTPYSLSNNRIDSAQILTSEISS